MITTKHSRDEKKFNIFRRDASIVRKSTSIRRNQSLAHKDSFDEDMERLDMYSLDSSSEEEKVRSDSKADHKENTDSRKAERGKVLINTKRLTRRVNFHHEKSAANNDKSQFER